MEANVGQLNGRFFVKIKKDDNWDTYLNNDVFPETESIDDNFNNGAVFEVEKLKIKALKVNWLITKLTLFIIDRRNF